MSADADRAQAGDLVALQALAGLSADLEDQPSPVIDPMLLGTPFLGPVRVSAAQHAPQLLADVRVHPDKGVRCHHVAVVVSPAPQRLVQRLDQGGHRSADVFTDQGSNLADEGGDALFGRGDVQHIGLSAEGLPEESKSVLDVRDKGLLLGEAQTPLCKERFDRRLVGPFEESFGLAGDDEVIGITDEGDAITARHCTTDHPLQAVQRHI